MRSTLLCLPLICVLAFACGSGATSGVPADAAVDGSTDALTDAPVQADAAPTGSRNVLLIIVDDVGAEEIRSFARGLRGSAASNGSAYITDKNGNGIPDGVEDTNSDGQPDGAIATPTIDTLAAAGIRFTQAWSNPLCSPTRAGIYTGRYAIHHGVGTPIGDTSAIWALPKDVPTLAEEMVKSGSAYKKGFFGKWHLGAKYSGTLPTDRGWDYFAGALEGELASYTNWKKVVVTEEGKRTDSQVTEYASTVNVNDALAWLTKQTKPWWTTVAFNAPHVPNEEPPASCLSGATTGTTDRALYKKMLECTDKHIGTLLAGISKGVLANTTIIFLGDNGTVGGVSDVYAPNRAKGNVYQGGVHVPLIVADGASLVGSTGSGLGTITSVGRDVSSLAQVVDIYATMAEIVGVKSSSQDAISLASYLGSTNAPAARTRAYTEVFKYESASLSTLEHSLANPAAVTTADIAKLTRTELSAAIRSTQYKLVYVDGAYELYDLAADPFEQVNKWCTSATYKTEGQALLTALRAIDASAYPAIACP